MTKKIMIAAAFAVLMGGCSSKSVNTSKYSVTEPTDYAMNCNSLLNEIKAIKAKINNDDSLLQTFVPDYLLGSESLSDDDKLVLSERKKSLQLIYTLKEAKGECRKLTVADTEEKGKIVKSIEKVKSTASKVSDAIQN